MSLKSVWTWVAPLDGGLHVSDPVNAAHLVAGPILGWRCWRLIETPGRVLLAALNNGAVYPPGEPMSGAGVGPGTGAGVYAYKTRERATEHLMSWSGATVQAAVIRPSVNTVAATTAFGGFAGPETFVFGQVALWGRVIEHEDGYRAEWGYPYRLQVRAESPAPCAPPMPGFPVVPPLPSLADRLRDTYGCEVIALG